MKEAINLDNMVWVDVDAVWLYPIIQEYNKAGKSLGMDYLSSGSLRYNERYFVGFIYNKESLEVPIELVSYIQYKIKPSKLIINYVETTQKYRGNGVAKRTIDEFARRVAGNNDISTIITTLSHDGKRANLMGKFQESLTGDVIEVNKGNAL